MNQYLPNFQGLCWRLANNWFDILKLDWDKPIVYCEVGLLHGANFISFAKTFGRHPDSQLVAVDPYVDYNDYPEYKGEQEQNMKTFFTNIDNAAIGHKVAFYREPSILVYNKFKDNMFDIVYLDGNHNPDAILTDAVLFWPKVKSGGVVIFDDYGWGGEDWTKRGIDAFVLGYKHKILGHAEHNGQYFVQKA